MLTSHQRVAVPCWLRGEDLASPVSIDGRRPDAAAAAPSGRMAALGKFLTRVDRVMRGWPVRATSPGPQQRHRVFAKIDRSFWLMPIIQTTHFTKKLRKRIALFPELPLLCA
jgi:hypothetical protein